MEYQRDEHRVHLLVSHLLWCPKRRKRVLVGHIADECVRLLRQTCQEHGWHVLEVAVQPDQVPLFVRVFPPASAADVVRAWTGLSAPALRAKHPARKAGLPSLWTSSSFASTAGQVSQAPIARYSAAQQGWERRSTVQFACPVPKAEADALTRESGRLSSARRTRHERLSRQPGVWLAPTSGDRLEDALGGPPTWQAHRRAAAHPGFYTAGKPANACKPAGRDTQYPSQQQRGRTTSWKRTGIPRKGGAVRLARARGLALGAAAVPSTLLPLPAAACLEARLVWERAARHASWHLLVEEGSQAAQIPGTPLAAGDRGEIPPAAVTDGKESASLTCRALRANQPSTAKGRSALRAKQDRKHQGARSWRRVQRRKARFLAKPQRRARDREQKASRAVVAWAKARGVSPLVSGDVRDGAAGQRLHTKSQQKIGRWSPGRHRTSSTSQAEAAGSTVVLCPEASTAQTCPRSQPCYQPTGRLYQCPACGFTAHRDAGGAANMLSQHSTGAPGQVVPPAPTDRYPFAGKRSRVDAPDLAGGPTTPGA